MQNYVRQLEASNAPFQCLKPLQHKKIRHMKVKPVNLSKRFTQFTQENNKNYLETFSARP